MSTRGNSKKLNQLTMELLRKLGNSEPTRPQIELMEALLTKITIEQKLLFAHQLTTSEIKCLLLAARGKTSSETAKLLGIQTSTVQSYRKEIKRKLACTSMAQAVFEGMRYGYHFIDDTWNG